MNETARKDMEYAKKLSEEEVLSMMRDAVLKDEPITVADGCTVHEPGGVCQHGHKSPLRVLGLV